jgi:hypothetical protein
MRHNTITNKAARASTTHREVLLWYFRDRGLLGIDTIVTIPHFRSLVPFLSASCYSGEVPKKNLISRDRDGV